jgi:hypothetical protein
LLAHACSDGVELEEWSCACLESGVFGLFSSVLFSKFEQVLSGALSFEEQES